jgi:hypothetical protein
VRGVAGQLVAKAFSFSLYSAVDVKVEILSGTGGAVAGATSVDNIQSPMPGGKTNYDSLATANVANGDYVIRVSAAGQKISSADYPAGFALEDTDGHYLLALSVNGNIAPTGPTDMAGCVSVANTPQSATFRAVASTDKKQGGACGILSSSDQNPFSGGMMLVVLTALAVQLLALAQRFRQRRALVRSKR